MISVVIPAFNAEASLQDAIGSAWSVGASEVVVVNDGSADTTSEIARSGGCVVIDVENGGAARARRIGVERATGEYVILLDSDDELVEVGVSASVEALERDTSLVAVSGVVVERTDAGQRRELGQWQEGISAKSLFERGHAPAPPAAFVWRSSALHSVLFDPPPGLWPRYAEDYELLIRASQLGEIGLHTHLSCVYARDGGKSARHPERSINSAQAIREHYAELLKIETLPMSWSRRTSLVLRKRSSSVTGVLRPLKRYFLLAVAAVLDWQYASSIVGRLK